MKMFIPVNVKHDNVTTYFVKLNIIMVNSEGASACRVINHRDARFVQSRSYLYSRYVLYFYRQLHRIHITVNPVLSGHSKIDKTKILMRDGSLMKVESIAECSLGAFYNTFDLH